MIGAKVGIGALHRMSTAARPSDPKTFRSLCVPRLGAGAFATHSGSPLHWWRKCKRTRLPKELASVAGPSAIYCV